MLNQLGKVMRELFAVNVLEKLFELLTGQILSKNDFICKLGVRGIAFGDAAIESPTVSALNMAEEICKSDVVR